jgi:hypothetical protein
MKTLTVGDDSYLVSDEIAHHLRSYHRLLAELGRDSEIRIPARTDAVEQTVVTLRLSRDTPRPIITDHDGDLAGPDDPDGLTDLLEQEALTMLHDMGELYEEIETDWRTYIEQRRR